ncbi:hypothetical protein Glove_423g55 [Diversispora epigaea]|uniref:TLDc domain-containing protein n=1 Tax=Diversispora epigaea TaxID=1348612 RepID=A0A397H0F5_9GLOM|nr:hypothetical protein Glove_423g55 [Diversispora epigaea]
MNSTILGSNSNCLTLINYLKIWINRVHKRDPTINYDFNLLARGTINGFSAQIFHEFCDNRGPTINFVRVAGTQEILGGYNPLYWVTPEHKSPSYISTDKSFIFSLNTIDIERTIFSQIKNKASAIEKAIRSSWDFGPSFGAMGHDADLKVCGKDFSKCRCRQQVYQEHIRKTDGFFKIDEYEVFQSPSYISTDKSFIFSLNTIDIERTIFSQIKNKASAIEKAIRSSWDFGPSFGAMGHDADLKVCGKDFSKCRCRQQVYQEHIRKTDGFFKIDEYEVFQVIMNE